MAQPIGQMNIVLSANAATFSEAIGQAQRQLNNLAGTSQKMGHATVTSVQAASGALKELNGDFVNNIRAVERFITTIPGVGAACKRRFLWLVALLSSPWLARWVKRSTTSSSK